MRVLTVPSGMPTYSAISLCDRPLQYASSTSVNQQWSVLTDANNVRLRNRATGLYLDGMGRTANGASVGQYGDSTSANQRWKIVAVP